MKDAKELSYSNVKDLTKKEIERLADYDLNSCDDCGSVESTYDLIWTEYIEAEELATLCKGILEHTAVCLACYGNYIIIPDRIEGAK